MKSKSRIADRHAGMIGKTTIFLLLAVFYWETIYAQENNNMNVASSPPRVEIPNTQILKMTSSIVGQEYDLYLHLPRGYASTNDSYPVLYLLDAQWDFPLVTAIFGQRVFVKKIN